MVRDQIYKLKLTCISAGILILVITGCSNEYGTVGPVLEGNSSLSGGSVLLMAGMPGGPGTSDGQGAVARFNSPRGIAAYGDTLYIADQNNHTIRKIDIKTNAVSTIAGYQGIAGVDDGAGKAARFAYPEGIETDGEYLYVADTLNHAIRKINLSTYIVTTLAGRRGQYGSTDGSGSKALFRSPTAIVLLGDYLYIADTNNFTIRRVNKNSGDTVTIAGSPSQSGSADGVGGDARFNFSLGITTDGQYLYIADTYNHTIRRLDPVTGEVYTLIGKAENAGYHDGTLTEAQFYYPHGLAVKGSHLYIADLWNEAIRVLDLSNGTVSTIAGTPPNSGFADGPPGIGRFYSPADLTVSGDYLYVADRGNNIIRRVDIFTEDILTVAGKASHSGVTDAKGDESRFSTPGGVVIDGDVLYVADTYNHTIRKVDILTSDVTTLAGTPGISGTSDSTESPAIFNSPTDVIVDEEGENLYIIDTGNHVIRRMNLPTGEVRRFAGYPDEAGSLDGIGRDARFNSPKRGIRIGDKIYITDTGNHTIRKIDIVTEEITTFAGESGKAGSVDTDEALNGIARFKSPGDIATDGLYLYVADTGNHAIRKIDLTTREVVTAAGIRGSSGLVDSLMNNVVSTPLFNSPEGIVWYDKILYVSDTGNHILRKVDLTTGEVSLLAGDVSCVDEVEEVSGSPVTKRVCTGQPLGTSAYNNSTDGTGKTAAFSGPTGIVTDGKYLYVMDTGGNLIRLVKMSTGETMTFSYSEHKGIRTNSPSGGELVGNLFYLADRGNHIIRKLDLTSLANLTKIDAQNLSGIPLITIAGTVSAKGYRSSDGYSPQFNRPIGIAADGKGNIYVADTGNHTIRKIVISTNPETMEETVGVTTVAGTPGVAGFMNSEFGFPMFNNPRGICIVDNVLYVSDSSNHLIRRVNLNTGYVGLVAGLSDYVTNTGSPGTADSTGAAAGFNDPRGITSDGTYLYVTDTGNHTIRRILRTTGQVKTIAGMPKEGGYLDGVGFDSRFRYPRGITVDGDYLYVADTGNNVLRRVNKNTGEVLTFSGNTGQSSFTPGERDEARFNNIISLTTASNTPYVYFSDSVENIIGKVEK